VGSPEERGRFFFDIVAFCGGLLCALIFLGERCLNLNIIHLTILS